MKRDDVIELARKHATCTSDGFHEFSNEELCALVAEVEQAMLERAANVATDEICGCCWDGESLEAASHIADAIRNLTKDTQ